MALNPRYFHIFGPHLTLLWIIIGLLDVIISKLLLKKVYELNLLIRVQFTGTLSKAVNSVITFLR